jgi:hypothetical protein
MGSWMGRQGQGAQARTTYWFNPRNKLQFEFRHQKVSQQLMADGGNLADASIRGEFCPHTKFSVSAEVQYERWLFPVIQPNASRDVTASVGLVLEPQRWFRHGSSNPSQP